MQRQDGFPWKLVGSAFFFPSGGGGLQESQREAADCRDAPNLTHITYPVGLSRCSWLFAKDSGRQGSNNPMKSISTDLDSKAIHKILPWTTDRFRFLVC